jgi:hypothetical protein
MPSVGITFAGSFIGIPGAYYADNVTLVPPPPPTTPPMIVVGYGWGPTPKVPMTFTSAGDVQVAVRGGPVSTFIPFINTPSPQLNGAQLITYIEAGRNTQAAAALLASGGQTIATLSSTLYGPPSNRMTYQVANGSVAGLRVILSDNYGGSQFVGDNLTVPFQLAYSGAATGAISYTVTSGSFTVTSPVQGETIVIPTGSGQYNTVALLTQFLNGTANWYAQALSATGGQLPANLLSPVTNVTLLPPSGGVPQYANVNAYVNDIPFWVNQFASTIAIATVSGAAQDNSAWLPTVGSPVFFSGATGVPPTNNDYATALNAALSVPGWTIFCDSAAPAVQALMAQHCLTASSVPYGMWRRGFTGSQIGDTITATIFNSRALNTKEMNYVYPGIYRINTVTGKNQLYSGLYAAAAACAMATGNPIPTPLTNKTLLASGVENANAGSPLTPSQLNQLQSNGVLSIYTPRNTGVPTFLADVTCWESDNNIENTSSQQVACRFWLAYSIVNCMQPYVGEIAAPVNEVALLNAVKRCLDALVYTGGGSSGVITSWDKTSLVLTYTGSNMTAAITVTVVLVGQNRFITCYTTIAPLQFQIITTG